ncbi:MAG: hypothetical protein AB1668_05910 [Nanoarchaeota archaeon]
MELEIKCLECGKRTRYFEIGPAVFTPEGDKEILLRDTITCPKCKKDISGGKCITPSGMFMISLMAITMEMMAEKEGNNFKLPPHLKGMAIVSKENYDILKKQSKASIKLVEKLNNYSANEVK